MESDLAIFTQSSVIDLLSDETSERLIQHRVNGKNAANAILDTLDNAVRMGWALSDIKKELKAPEAFESFVESRLDIGLSQANKYAKVSRSFNRDEEHLKFTEYIRHVCGLEPLLIDVAVPVHLKQQILETKANSFMDLMRSAGIAKPKALRDKDISVAAKPSFLRMGKAISSAWVKIQRINKSDDILTWGAEERRSVREDLAPLVKFYESLLE